MHKEALCDEYNPSLINLLLWHLTSSFHTSLLLIKHLVRFLFLLWFSLISRMGLPSVKLTLSVTQNLCIWAFAFPSLLCHLRTWYYVGISILILWLSGNRQGSSNGLVPSDSFPFPIRPFDLYLWGP